MLQRLELKKLVQRDRSAHPHVFSACADRSSVAGQELEAMADKLAGGSLAPFLTHLVQSDQLTKTEIDELREMLDQASRRRR